MSGRMVQLGQNVDIIMGQAPPGSACNKEGQGTPFVKAGEFSEAGPIIREWTTKPLKLACRNDVLVCVVGATAGKINRGLDCAIGRSVAAVRPLESKLNSDFLRFFLECKTLELRARSQGLAQGVITRDMLESLEIPLPPLDEQKRIATILDKADALRRKRRQALALLDSLTQSIFLEMFGDPVTNPKGWPIRELGDFEAFLTSGSRGWAEFYAAEGRAFIRIQNLKSGKLSTDDLVFVNAPNNAESRRTTVSAGDVLISITADLGRIAVVPLSLDGAANINQHIALFRPRGINSSFLAGYLASDGGKQFSASNRQGVKAGLNFTDIRRLRIVVPPLEMQAKFENILASLEMRQIAYNTSEGHNDSLFASLQHRAFTGQL